MDRLPQLLQQLGEEQHLDFWIEMHWDGRIVS
jgi:hypothetical protein